ncbi:MAG: S8 family serine peptidase, partial [Actinobacteria bacterium]|nr:S8 family serine peptidase [Actinomycetota bacterium]
YIRIVGVAPGASIVALKAGSELLPNSAILQAIDYAVTTAHVDVINESFGGNIYPDSGARNTIQLFDDQAVKAGVTVTVSTGDAGTTSTIGNPSTDPLLISAGATTDSQLYEQTGYALATRFGNGKWADDNISSLSSAGITQNGRTIDISAPGEADWAVCDDSGNFTACTNYHGGLSPFQAFGGTSQSAPFTAGVSALVIQAYRKTHGAASPTPAIVKQIITSTAHDLGMPGIEQGSGRIDALAAVEAAQTWPGAKTAPAGLSSNIALSSDQLTLEGDPGSTQTGKVTVTNVGTSALTVLPSTRRYASLTGTQAQTVAIDASSAQTVPYPTTGAPWVYKTTTFTVPAGTDRLEARLLWASGAGPNQAGPVVRLSLFAPDGTYEANSRPQGGAAPANYANVDVRQPAAGTWTAVLYTNHGAAGFTGNVTLATDSQRAIPVGSVSPGPFTLAPGASRDVSVSVPVPSVGGDTDYTMALATSSGHQVAVPLIVRAVVPTNARGTGTFTGTITGGNARALAPAQTFAFDFDVPAGQHDLDVGLTLAKDPGDTIEGILVDPNGETPSTNSNNLITGAQGRAVANFVAKPQAGRWRYVVVVLNPVSGNELSQTFTGTVAFNRVAASINGTVTTAAVRSGSAQPATVTVTNPGPEPIAVGLDARLNVQQTVQLSPQLAGATFPLPLSVDDLASVPYWLVPPDTQKFALSAASTVPAQVELQSPAGGIDLFGDLQQAQNGSTISTATVREKAPAYVGQGYWGTYVQEIGPFGDSGAPAGSTTEVGNATTLAFDRSVTSSTGDPYLVAVDPTAPNPTPVIVQPGQTVTIKVTVTPTGAKGSQVSGVLNVVTTPFIAANGSFITTGDVIATLPYSYTVG